MCPDNNSQKDILTEEFIRKNGDLCACVTTTPFQKVYYPAILFIAVVLLLYRWDFFVAAVSAILYFCYFMAVSIRFGAGVVSLFKGSEKHVSKETLDAVKDGDLPVYTILLPLYHESAVADKILKRMGAIDYPHDKLDVKLLLECDDDETRTALGAIKLPSWCEIINVPDGVVRTKPRACNYGLAAARGEFCVIYDAEDKPEPDQLKKAVSVFRADKEKKILCVQAKLNYYNSRQNILTKFFTVEYSTNFDMQLPGLQVFKLPLPLGGTSNHFRTEILKEVGPWDPFNVTEDCDLGIRIYEASYRTCVLDSTTWEEANSEVWNWIRQRSRWVKGFLQTHLVHYRNPFSTMRRLGVWGFFGCYAFVGGSVLMMLANLVFWPMIILYIALLCHGAANGETLASMIIGPHTAESVYTGIHIGSFTLKAWPLVYMGAAEDVFMSTLSQIFFFAGIFLFFMNILLVLVHVAGCVKRGFYNLIPWALLMPFYWVLISIGAWKGVLQFITKPFYWEKTKHGLDTEENASKEEQNALL